MEQTKKTKIDCQIIPIPKEVEYFDGKVEIPAAIYTEKTEWKYLTKTFCDSAEKIFYTEIKEEAGAIELIYDEGVEKGAYIIEIDKKVLIYASDSEGANYGLVSVLQLATLADENFEFEKMKIYDKPDKEYRGLMVDIARVWHPFETLFKYVDLCYYFKAKYLHLHVMDSSGYVLPSKEFPNLSLNGNKYTFEQIKTLCEYAKNRAIVLIPEIEMPGHVKVLNREYPELFSDELGGKNTVITTDVGAVMDSTTVLCPGSETAFLNIKKLIDEVIGLFGDIPYLHLGGDEVNTASWENCSVCKKYMETNNIKDVEELYADFLGRVTDYVLSKGVTPIVWEGFSKEYSHYISKEVVVIAWETLYQLPQSLIEEGFKIINCAWKPLYIVPPYCIPQKEDEWGIREILNWNVYEWQNWWEATESGLNPIHIQPTDELLGAQVCSWEQSFEEEISFIVRFLASAMERTWSVRRFRNYKTYTAMHKIQSAKAFKLIV